MTTAAEAENLLALPVAAVPAIWLQREFETALVHRLRDEIADGGILWLPTDSPQEGEFLLSAIHRLLRLHLDGQPTGGERGDGWLPHELVVEERDPFLFWEDIVGFAEDARLLDGQSLSAASLVLVRGAHFLPGDYLRRQTGVLAKICRTFRWIFVLPVFRQTAKELDLPFVGDSLISVPSLQDEEPARVRALVTQLVANQLPLLPEELRPSFVHRIVSARPQSRYQIEIWINEYVSGASEDPIAIASTDWDALLRVVPPPQRFYRHAPPKVLTRVELEYLLSVAKIALDLASDGFQAWSGERLFEPMQDFAGPFDSPDPAHWFSAMVSYISCLVFDAGSPNVLFLSGFTYDPDQGDFIATARPTFFDVLRAIRTSMQHGLNLNRAKDRQTLEKVRQWYIERCDAARPARHHWRSLTTALVTDWVAIATRLQIVATHLNDGPSTQVIYSQWLLHQRRLPAEAVRDIFAEVTAQIDPNLDSGRLSQRYQDQLQNQINRSVVGTASLDAEARRLVREYIVQESARCPISEVNLRDLGVEKGPRMGRLLHFAENAWRTDPLLDTSALIAMIRQRLESST